MSNETYNPEDHKDLIARNLSRVYDLNTFVTTPDMEVTFSNNCDLKNFMTTYERMKKWASTVGVGELNEFDNRHQPLDLYLKLVCEADPILVGIKTSFYKYFNDLTEEYQLTLAYVFYRFLDSLLVIGDNMWQINRHYPHVKITFKSETICTLIEMANKDGNFHDFYRYATDWLIVDKSAKILDLIDGKIIEMSLPVTFELN